MFVLVYHSKFLNVFVNLIQSLHSSVGFMSSIINLAVCIGEKTARISAGGGEICPIIAIITVGDMGEPISTPLLMSSGSVLAAVDGSGGGGGGGRPMCAIDVGDPTSSSSLSSSSGVSDGGTAGSAQKKSCSSTSHQV